MRWLTTAALVLMACGPADATGRAKGITALTGDATHGALVYKERCGSCHGATGVGGGLYPDLTHHFPLHTNLEMATIILNGEGDMVGIPSMADQDVADVIAHGRSVFK
jgi:mono/diheme cytochrome c family protein